MESGRLRVRSPGELTVVSLTRRHPVQAAVLDAFGPAGHRSVETAPTAAGRRALRALRAAPPADAVAAGTSVMRVDLAGQYGMPHRALREAVFVESQPERLPRGRGRRAG